MTGKPVIGLEVHVQLNTVTKLFCGCPTKTSAPNSSTCPTCLGMPGSKPVLNRKAVEFALRIAIALDCEINRQFFFSRKTYFYPDMAKNFQITQYEMPVAAEGMLKLSEGRQIRIRRIQLEEDPAALIHGAGLHSSKHSLVDYNRSGIPLVEIVTQPDIESPKEARDFLDHLVLVLSYLGVFRLGANTLKADCNVSLAGGERVEIKNISGQRAVEKAIEYEIKRQGAKMAQGEKIVRETRSFDEATLTTKSLRSKELEEDYGYIFDPDLVMAELSDGEINEARASMPELHEQRAKRLVQEYGMDYSAAKVLASGFELSNIALEVLGHRRFKPAVVSGVFVVDIPAILNRSNIQIENSGIQAEDLLYLMGLLEDGKITDQVSKEALIGYLTKGEKPRDFISRNNLLKDVSPSETEKIVDEVLQQNPQAIADYRKGEARALNFLVGIIMRQTRGKADPKIVQKLIEEKIK